MNKMARANHTLLKITLTCGLESHKWVRLYRVVINIPELEMRTVFLEVYRNIPLIFPFRKHLENVLEWIHS